MNVWDQAKDMHRQAGLNWDHQFRYYQEFGHIISSPNHLIWGEDVNGSWLVYLAIGPDCIKTFIQQQPYYLPRFAFCRLLRGRHSLKSYSMDRVARLCGVDLDHIKKHGITS